MRGESVIMVIILGVTCTGQTDYILYLFYFILLIIILELGLLAKGLTS